MPHKREMPSRNPIRAKQGGYGGCPVCGEKRITQDIYDGTFTYLCGYSGHSNGRAITACQGAYFQQFLEQPEESIWEGIW